MLRRLSFFPMEKFLDYIKNIICSLDNKFSELLLKLQILTDDAFANDGLSTNKFGESSYK